MTFTNVNNMETAVSKFRGLDADDKLAVLAQLYEEIAAEVAPMTSQNDKVDENACNLVKQIQNLSSEKQLDILRYLVSGKQSSGETELDQHPTQALGELLRGGEQGSSVSFNAYQSLSADSRLFFWFQLAQNLGKSVTGVPDDYTLTEQVSEVLDLIDTPNLEDLVSFLKKTL